MNRYKETTEWLFNQLPMFQNTGAGAYKPGLETVEALSAHFGAPHRCLRTIHVAGTNGKGSTSSLLAAVLTSAGYRVGLYTSPHLVDFRERIRVNGQMIPESYVVDFIDRYKSANLKLEPSFFELTTVMAFEYFSRMKVDIAVIEVGLGGRLDSTNIITPDLCVITNISLDHTALLGNTPAEIAREKAGIIKPGVPVVIGEAEGEVRRVFQETADSVGAPAIFVDDCANPLAVWRNDDTISYPMTPWGEVVCELSGDCQPRNAYTAMCALQILQNSGVAITPEAVREGFANVRRLTGLTGRWTVLSENPRVICDTGHNPGGWQYLGPRLADIASRTTLRIVIGFVSDKDITAILSKLPRNAVYYFAAPSVRRARPVEELAAQAMSAGLLGKSFPNVPEAFEAALADSAPTDTIFVGGSTFVVADLLASRPK